MHRVPPGSRRSVGHIEPVPVQVSAASHGPRAARHTTVLAAKRSIGQSAAVPVQTSTRSHSVASARQTVPPATKPSVQAALEPEQ
jgi:hypothetical protein